MLSGAADEDGAIRVPILHLVLDGGTVVVLLFLLGYFGAGLVFRGIRLGGLDAEEGAARLLGYLFCHVLCVAAPTEVSDQSLLALCVQSRSAHQEEGDESDDSCFHIQSAAIK